MRQIKFRIWDGEKFYFTTKQIDIFPAGLSDTYGLFFKITPNERVETGPSGYGLAKKVIIQQFSGLYDKNGREIFEGDVVKIGDRFKQVIFDLGMFYIDEEYGDLVPVSEVDNIMEVVGNIFENTELSFNDCE